MNRREFINSITAAAATTAMPMPSIAMRGASPVVPAAVQTLIHQGYLRPVQIVAPQTGANTLAQANQKIGDAVKRVVSADDDAANEDDALNADDQA